MKVVLLPGLDGTGMLFKPFLDSLTSDIEVQVVTYPVDKYLSYSELVELVLNTLPKEDFILVGESFSGPIAYQVALERPENLLSVIFVATFLTPPKKYILKLSNIFPVSLLLKIPLPTYLIKKYLFDREIADDVIGLFREVIKSVSPRVLSFRLGEISRLKASKKHCDVRAIYIQASNDKLVSSLSVDSFKNSCEALTVVRVAGAHFILQSNPSACSKIIKNEVRSLLSCSD